MSKKELSDTDKTELTLRRKVKELEDLTLDVIDWNDTKQVLDMSILIKLKKAIHYKLSKEEKDYIEKEK